MGFVGVVKFAVKCVDVLAWHLFALVYPLCASVQAIESGSSSDTTKLVAYWLLFSLLLLFEHAFEKLLQWIPFWLYIELTIFWWLVIPNFNGAFYAYKHILRPCLYMDTKVLIKQLKEKIEFFFKKNEFEAEVKKCLKENGPKAPEELVGIKDLDAVKMQSINFVQKDVKTVGVIERKNVSAVKKVYLTEHELAQTKDKNFAPKKLKETFKTVASVTEFPEIPVSNKVKWTCPLCQMTTESVTTPNSHLEGQRHEAALEKLQAKNEPSKMAVWEEVKAKNQPSKQAACEEVKAKNQPSKQAACEEVKAKNQPSKQAVWVEVKAKNQPSETKVPPASEHKTSGLPVQKPANSSSSSQKLQCQQEKQV